ncbi:glycosyltransferase [Hymenobacter sp. BT770]|uniref:glycosyltransferase n=1 Tax=Hymenobacter sp. BT770 TaxID=2886942 RepID=UPI001D11B385|nr:glycosyltransferase [Hymenobacter sp. BT770]MCC3155279.1 bifunctional glycosyltransferase/class I SAM-dependent methyltransferase [Hymenobacter sp. BT770]MDO3417256.1 glycosyltransferase [Hymenobacter sp. BT770]
MQKKGPLVSVIIPCFNQGEYLLDSILSARGQTWENVEVIVVDDGSTDNTHEICVLFNEIIYVHQYNQGLSSARNKGFQESKGDFLVFLDADDWLFPDAISINLTYLQENPKAAFVSGAHDRVDRNGNWLLTISDAVETDHYLNLLRGNYIHMHATILFRRWALPLYPYDVDLLVCEDYDLCLRIARNYDVIHHSKKIAVYRTYDSSMSGNIPLMHKTIGQVLRNQLKFLRNQEEHNALQTGIRETQKRYIIQLTSRLMESRKSFYTNFSKTSIQLLFKNFTLFISTAFSVMLYHVKRLVKKYTPEAFFPYLYKISASRKVVNMGSLNRVQPFSTVFGYDRGGPIDRYYIESFLKKNATLISGHVLEVGDNIYTIKFGGESVIKSDILHVDDTNTGATYTGDLSNAPHIPSDLFDCIILTQTLHLIYDFKGALETCFRILKPGGALLLTVPGISQIDYGEWEDTWLWSFTKGAIKRLLNESFPLAQLEIETHGNVLTSAAFLFGMGVPEISYEHLNFNDPHYQLIITAKAFKPKS